MKNIVIQSKPGFSEWRSHAKTCFCEGIAPEYVLWNDAAYGAADLFQNDHTSPSACKEFSVPREFVELAQYAICHAASERFSLLYRILWRLKRGKPNLLKLKTDDDILALHRMVKAVRRDAYKIKAFLRFRQIDTEQGEAFVAWYEPEHYSLELSLPFFQTRFKNMTWSILTPYMAAHWDREQLLTSDNPDPSIVPTDDTVERYWLKYYASTFNPARPKKSAMLNQMPKKYWKNMPETVLIPDLLRTSESRARKMIKDSRNDG